MNVSRLRLASLNSHPSDYLGKGCGSILLSRQKNGDVTVRPLFNENSPNLLITVTANEKLRLLRVGGIMWVTVETPWVKEVREKAAGVVDEIDQQYWVAAASAPVY